MLVCHNWKSLIEYFLLYHTLYIKSSLCLRTLTTKLQNLSVAAKQTERVIFYYQRDDYVLNELNSLIVLLSNLKVPLNLKTLSEGSLRAPDTLIYQWANKITPLSETAGNSVSQRLFESQFSGTCANQTSLHLNLKSCEERHNDNYFDMFKCVPALESLQIEEFCAELYQLEILHGHLNHLKSVSFDSIYIGDVYTGGRHWSSKDVVPARSVTDCLFHFRVLDQVDDYIELLNFISKKYPSLTSLSNISHHSTISEYDTSYLNQQGWKPLLSRFGSQLKRLWTNSSGNLDNVFETLNQCHCDLSYLKLGFFPWCNINNMQNQHIQTLVLSCSRSTKPREFDWLRQLGSLKKLKLLGFNICKFNVKLDALIDNAPSTLKTLSLVDMSISSRRKYNNSITIEFLTLQNVRVPDNMDNFLSHHFPTLTKLNLYNCGLRERHLNMPEANLDYFCFIDPSVYLDSNALVVTRSERRVYRLVNKGLNKTWFGNGSKTIPNTILYVPFELRSIDDNNLSFHFILSLLDQ